MSEAERALNASESEADIGTKPWVAPAMGPMGQATARALGAVPPEPTPPETAGDREEIVREAVEEWTRRLVNLDGRNRMLYFRELRRGTLEITPTRRGVKPDGVAKLLDEGAAQLSEIFASEALSDAALRTLALAAKARTNFEEKGLATLYIGHSFATWQRSDGHTPRAPMAMIPIAIRLDSPGGHDAIIELRGSAEANPSLVHAMRADLGRDPYPDAAERPSDFREWLPSVAVECSELPGFSIDDRLFLANLEFSKLPMVNDMEHHLNLLVGNDVVAAIAGHTPALEAINLGVEVDEDLPDRTPPEKDFLVCDADASQNQALNAAMRGQSLVIHGPPGTGKSQTIANLISSLSAEGKSVLFVAEKRAAIGAVTRRLDAAGCGELVLDLHDGSNRRQVVKSLEDSIHSIAQHAGHDIVAPHSNLWSTRKKLAAHRAQMHQPREPHGLSFFQLQAMVGTPDHEITGVRIPQEVLAKWTDNGRAEVRALVARWHVLADRIADDESGFWAGSLIRSSDDAYEVKAGAQSLQSRFIPAVEDAYRAALASLHLPANLSIPIDEFAALIADIDDFAGRYQPAFFEAAEEIATALKPSQKSAPGRIISSLFNGTYRRAKRSLVDMARGPVDQKSALRDARRIVAHRKQWAEWLGGEPLPMQAPGAGALTIALSEYKAARSVVERMVPAVAAVGDFATEKHVLLEVAERLDLADARAELAITEAAITEFGLGPLVRDTTKADRSSNDIGEMAMRVFAASAIDAVTWQEPELAMFNGRAHEASAREFAKLDRRHMEATAPRVMKRVAEKAALTMKRRPREAALLRHEVETGAHNMPIRQLLGSMTTVAQALRPCWAISPLLVSRILPAIPGMFDVVIFDEGSQILPIHAIPSIARASQVIVAGDPHQLPPAEGYQVSESLEDQPDDDEHHDAATDAESILDVMRGLVPEHRLLWHYRSQDERLINFSNGNIYDRSLVTFPGTKQGTGIRHILAGDVPKHAEGTSSNPGVVRQVVELILYHAAHRPDESLGVIALGKRHATDISRALRVARLESDVYFGGFFEDKGVEPFFVKVMSDAQGDERDHIIVSVGYGRNPSGDVVYRWGALNTRGGHRRLNVAATRSKRRMTVVSAVGSEEIDAARTKSRGMDLLRQFIAYAENGGEAMPGPDTGALTAFEESVLERLTRAQIPVEAHYGGGRHRIDFAALDPKFANQPVLAIETDGTGYNSSSTARDRDRLRLEVLGKRGWRHHRIWSVDWYRDPDGETARVKEAWADAVAASDDRTLAAKAGSDGERPVVAGRGRSPVPIRRTGILGYERDELVRLIKWIQSDGEYRNEEDLIVEAFQVLELTAKARNHRAERALRGAIAEARAVD
ncbi:MAG: DUF4011 domain-containing protein [Acidimicrobiia bacterium]|nr:DUF4011 domain-containing protein [Acidimicrobiia bacterium]